ncbi:MAG: hypothetical protein GTO45_37955 [Candidatus Aminicenantes bacterium]|nr:hypothetical protein [Candidatus Aminicenantes bacterium]NIM80489.1 hypothetical protein [Candidatus Aminicenantes bacterium]NIN23931.1 hypothetical protein [Candidatus Aminicenantes bacterium]NIN47645.1 hypothetical protein [Candidatus Aminicenantes bacterium]NIN90575.1 hypothetical protein [Candidatus Aminicenantes bacterium]
MEALVLYPEKVRNAVLEASLYPELLVKISNVQERSREQFKEILSPYDRKIQETIWDLVRYPELVEIIAKNREKSGKELLKQVENYPEEVRSNVRAVGIDYQEVFMKIYRLQEESGSVYESLINNYPPTAISAYRELVRFPEILSILTDNISLTILLGDMYRNNPQQIKKQLEELHIEVVRQQSQAVDSWRKSLEEDPEAMEEFEQSAEEYAREQGYDVEKMKVTETEKPADTGTRVEVYYVNPYPYWFGYPYWYPYPRWYRYPYWYDWGFYYGPRGTIIIVDLPSYYYVDWHFRRYYYVRHYPRISKRFILYSERHRNLNTGIKRAVEHHIRKYPGEYPQYRIRKDSLGKLTQPSPPARDLKERKYQLKREPPDKHKQLQKAREYHQGTWKVQPTKPPQKPAGTQLKKKQQQKPQTPPPPKKQEKKKYNKEKE